MATARKPGPRRKSARRPAAPALSPLVRICLAVLAVSALTIGVLASFVPETFYEDYPFFSSWVHLLPPYNEHLIRDVGGLYLGFGLLFAWSLIRPSVELIVPVCIAWALAQVLHFAFHIDHLEGFTTTDSIAQTIGLAAFVVLALIPVAALKPKSAVRRR